MANGYFKDEDKERKVAFDVFYRKNPDNAGYAIFAGLEQSIEYIENLQMCIRDRYNLGCFSNPLQQSD